MKNLFVALLLTAMLALPALAQQTGSTTQDQPAAAAATSSTDQSAASATGATGKPPLQPALTKASGAR